jgi:hypothetical protein
VDAALAVLTLHHWSDWRLGVRELLRVSRRRVVVLAHDVDALAAAEFWLLRDYFPGLLAGEEHPALGELQAALGAKVQAIPVPADCTDGFLGAYWSRPAAYLDPGTRAAISSFHRLDPVTLTEGLRRLQADLDGGRWRRRNAELLERRSLDLGYRLLVADVESPRG